MMTIIFWIIAVIFILIGLAGTVIPAIPGTPLMYAGFLLAAWIDNFQRIGWITLIILGVLTLFSLGVDLLATSFGAKRMGASRSAIIGAIIGFFIGIFFGFPGLLIIPFLGAVIGEYIHRSNWAEAGKIGFGTWLGLAFGFAMKVSIAFTMLGIFILSFIF